ncbi:hypothetical protein ACIP4U_14790 [Streptomyces caelestis]|uniref:hypothetical protein n=1 Tax=Streptomyces caelestis TaxID=36816 RepID=UPI00380A863C
MHPFRKAVESDDLEAVAAVGDLMHFDDDGKIDDFTAGLRTLLVERHNVHGGPVGPVGGS